MHLSLAFQIIDQGILTGYQFLVHPDLGHKNIPLCLQFTLLPELLLGQLVKGFLLIPDQLREPSILAHDISIVIPSEINLMHQVFLLPTLGLELFREVFVLALQVLYLLLPCLQVQNQFVETHLQLGITLHYHPIQLVYQFLVFPTLVR